MYEKLKQLYLENTNQNLGMPTKCVLTRIDPLYGYIEIM